MQKQANERIALLEYDAMRVADETRLPIVAYRYIRKKMPCDAVTKVTVWKRFNDFKKLHRELKVLHRKPKLKNIYPNLPSKTIFKRFDEETIESRKQSILNFLDFISNNSQLFTSNEFVKFLETSYTPEKHLSSNINSIRADLSLPEDPEVCTSLSTNSDEDKTISDTDSVTTMSSEMSSLSLSIQTDTLSEPLNHGHTFSHSRIKKFSSPSRQIHKRHRKNSDTLSITTMLDSITLLDGQIYPTPPNTPGSSVALDYMQYIVDATVHINLAVELENDKKYEEAYTAYKAAIDILLKYGKEDSNYDRRQMVRYKANKYLIRAEKNL
ncbi:hypothetical protein NQ317_001759 [Molorchus minor]|uniref:PX domain-containing protein n=1 Tax=Molorchus minor TaxID=1323400 RepID=A0ABQ9JIG2_9CUCU|nr:hypothetical protein NQ317_001759 [Molorchus minor]